MDPRLCDAKALEGRQVLEQLDPADERGALLHGVPAGGPHDLTKGVAVESPTDAVLRRPHGRVPPFAVQERQLPEGTARGILKNFGFWPAWNLEF